MLGRRRLLLLVGGAAIYPACGKSGSNPVTGEGGADGSVPSEAGFDAADAMGGENDSGPSPDALAGSDGKAADGSSDAVGNEAGEVDATNPLDASSGSDTGAAQDASTDCPEQVDGGCATGADVLFLPFCSYPQLLTVGVAVQTIASNYSDPVCHQNNVIVINAAPGQFVALASSCTHACCQVELNAGLLRCPCHGVEFNLQGQVVSGSQDTNTPLQVLQTCWDSSGVYVTT